MNHTFGKQARRIGLALAAVVALAVLGIKTPLADTTATAPATSPTFTNVDFSIASGNGGSEKAIPAGALICSWRETGLQPYQLIPYACDAEVVGAVEACVYRNKIVGNAGTQLSVFQHPLIVNGGIAEGSVSNNSGSINGTTSTTVPVSEGAGGELCPEPAEAAVVAVRWCNASLTDTVNNIVGGTTAELFAVFNGFTGTVPSCAELAAMPPTAGGE